MDIVLYEDSVSDDGLLVYSHDVKICWVMNEDQMSSLFVISIMSLENLTTFSLITKIGNNEVSNERDKMPLPSGGHNYMCLKEKK